MAETSIRDGRLVEMYHRYVGEPGSKRDIYGYWLFLLGCLVGLAGVVVYQIEQAVFPGNFAVREVAIVLAAVGLPVGLLGIVSLLPVRRRGMQASVVGLLVAFAGVAAFTSAYPDSWYVPPDSSPGIIALYTAGIALIAGVAILVPILTGERGLLVEPNLGLADDSPPILTGEAARDAFFAVYRGPSNEWAWRVIQRDAVGESARLAPTDTDARIAIEEVRELIGDAGLHEITTAAFRLYETETGEWRWSLVLEDGSAVARSDAPLPDRDAADSTVNLLKEQVPDAGVLDIRSAAFDVFEAESGRWRWRLLDDRRRPLASGAGTFPDEDAASAGTDAFVERMETARPVTLESVGVEVFADDDAWRWRVIDGDDSLVTSATSFESRPRAEDAATDVIKRVDGATVIDAGTAGYEVYAVGDDWRWRLRDRTDDLVAEIHGRVTSEDDARRGAERVSERVANADSFEFEGADYEVYAADGAWHWRLVAADRTVLADSTTRYEDREPATAALDRVREQSLAADLIEFEHAAFQQYESDGEWRWRLIDKDGQVMADSGEEYDSKGETMEAMTTLKENAPNAEILEIETAAFEIYRTTGGDYAWRLVDETGRTIAESAATEPSRAAAREAVDFLLAHIDDAAVRLMDAEAFQLYTDGDSWRWWLVSPDGTVLADSVDDYTTRDAATASVETVRTAGDGAPLDVVGPVTVQLRNGSGWHWRLIDRDRAPLAEGDSTYETREAAVADVELLADGADAPLFELGSGVVWIETADDGWRWRLVDGKGTDLATSTSAFVSAETAEDAVEDVAARAPEAGAIDFDAAAFELYRDDGDAWHWRLLDEDEAILAVSAVGYDTRTDASEAMDGIPEIVGRASILEIDEVAFELHARDGGWVWRFLSETGTPLAESAEPHDTRREAREAMLSVKVHAPTAQTTVTW